MSEAKPVITWTCNRCKAEVTLPSDKQPKWLRLWGASPPRRAKDDIASSWDLCPDCDHEFAEFMHPDSSKFPRDDLRRRVALMHETTEDKTYRDVYDVVLAIIDQHQPPGDAS